MITQIQDRPLIIRTNFGDESLALTQWAFETGLAARIVYIDTGWAASSWADRIRLGESHAEHCGFEVVRLISPISFADAVLGREAFPSPKLQWCAGLLKGLPFLDWLEIIDLAGKAIILLAKRRMASIHHAELSEWLPQCQFHGDRSVWHPLLDWSDLERDGLLERAGFTPLRHRSLECEPCPNSSCADLKRIAPVDKQRLLELESVLGSAWEALSEVSSSTETENYLDLFYRGCGNPFGCGF